MSKVLTRQNIESAVAAIEAYEATCRGLHSDFDRIMSTMFATNWNGDGSDGCREFFNAAIVPAIGAEDGLLLSITTMTKGILENIKYTCLDNVDPNIGAANRNPGGGA